MNKIYCGETLQKGLEKIEPKQLNEKQSLKEKTKDGLSENKFGKREQ